MIRCKIINLFFARSIYVFIILFSFLSFASSSEVVSRIDVQGNNLVSDATIISKIKMRAGHEYNTNIINEDIRNLYATGFFESVEVERKDSTEGIIVVFKVLEKPVIKKLSIDGERIIREKKILDAIGIKEGAFADEYKLKESIRKIQDIYTKKGFTQTVITYTIIPLQVKNEVEVKFTIDEKGVLKVRTISVVGNKTFPAKRIIKIMKTRTAWLFNSGIYKEDILQDDVKRITDFYKNEGFTDVIVDKKIELENKSVHVKMTVEEGKRYYIGKVGVEGYKEITANEITTARKLKEGDIYSEQSVYDESAKIREVYVDKGYIFSQVDPLTYLNLETQKVDVTYKITENQIAYIEKINVTGNFKTKDNVIRRELRIYPQDRFDGKKVRKSKSRLENLGFFEEIRFGTEPASQSNWVDLIVDVKEAKTGYVSFGGGYSSIDAFIGFVELRQRNFDYKNFSTFTGAGQDLSLTTSFGTTTKNYQLSFTNPWIFDKPVSFGFDLYQKSHEKDDDSGYSYDEEVLGGALRLGREFNDNIKGNVAYRIENIKIDDISADAAQDFRDEEGRNTLSGGELSLTYDTRDNVFNPLRGIYLLNTGEIVGGPFGGDKDFFKYFTQASVFFPMVKKSVLEVKLRAGFAEPFSDTKKVPIYRRFYAGGASTIRGYPERKVGPVDIPTKDPIGGESMFIGNIEYTYPLIDFLKLATFFDTGNVWEKNKDFFKGGLKSSYGLGLRVKTPIGPISVDYGWPLNDIPGESKKGRFHFNISKGF